MITPVGIQFSPRNKQGDKCCPKQSFGINPGELSNEGEKTLKEAASELGTVVVREAKKKVEQVKEDSKPIIIQTKKHIKGLMELLSKKLQEGAGKIKIDE